MGRPFLIVKEMVMPPEVYGAVRLDLDPYPIMINKLHCKGRKLVSLVHESLHIAEKELDFQMIGTQGHQDLHVLATLLTSSILPLMKRLRTMPNPTGRFRFQLNQFPFRLQHTGCASLECEQETLLEILRRYVVLFKLSFPMTKLRSLAKYILAVTEPLLDHYS